MLITEMSEDWKITANVKDIISFTLPGRDYYVEEDWKCKSSYLLHLE